MKRVIDLLLFTFAQFLNSSSSSSSSSKKKTLFLFFDFTCDQSKKKKIEKEKIERELESKMWKRERKKVRGIRKRVSKQVVKESKRVRRERCERMKHYFVVIGYENGSNVVYYINHPPLITMTTKAKVRKKFFKTIQIN